MSRLLSAALAVPFIAVVGFAAAPDGAAAATGNSSAAVRQATPANQFATEAEAKSRCGSDMVVWANTKTHVYHFAGSKDFGHTKHGAYMCRADADHGATFHAAKNEKPPTAR